MIRGPLLNPDPPVCCLLSNQPRLPFCLLSFAPYLIFMPSLLTPAQVQLVLDVSRLLVVTTDLDLLLQRIAEAAVSLLHCRRATIFLHDAQRDELCSRIALGEAEIRLPAGAGIAGDCFTNNRPIIVPNAYADPRFLQSIDDTTRFTTQNLLAVPLINADHRPIGVLEALNKETGFTDTDTALLQLLADQAGVALQRYELQQAALKAESLRREMDLAQRVQRAMIPRRPPTISGLEAAGWTNRRPSPAAIPMTCGRCPMGGWGYLSPMLRGTGWRRR